MGTSAALGLPASAVAVAACFLFAAGVMPWAHSTFFSCCCCCYPPAVCGNGSNKGLKHFGPSYQGSIKAKPKTPPETEEWFVIPSARSKVSGPEDVWKPSASRECGKKKRCWLKLLQTACWCQQSWRDESKLGRAKWNKTPKISTGWKLHYRFLYCTTALVLQS